MYPISYNSFKNFPKNSNLPDHELKRKYFLLSSQGRLISECANYPLFPDFVDCDLVSISKYQSLYDGTSIQISGSIDLLDQEGRYMKILETTDGGGLGPLPKYSGNNSSAIILYDLLGIHGAGWYIDFFGTILYYSLESVVAPWLVTTWTIDQGAGPVPVIIQGPAAISNGTRILITETLDPTQYEWDSHGGEIAIKTPSGWDYESHPLGTVVRDQRYLLGGSLYTSYQVSQAYYRLTSNPTNTVHAIYWFQVINQLDPGPPSISTLNIGDTQGTTTLYFSSCREMRVQYTEDPDGNSSEVEWIDTNTFYLESQWTPLSQFGYQIGLLVDFPVSAQWIRIKYTVKGVLQGYSAPGSPTA